MLARNRVALARMEQAQADSQTRQDADQGQDSPSPLLRMAARRKQAAQADAAALQGAFRVAFGRMARGLPGFDAAAREISYGPSSLAEIVDLAEAGMFLAVLDGPDDRLGLAVLCPGLMAGLLEAITTGRIDDTGDLPDTPRKPTPTDAALLGPVIDALLTQITERLADRPEHVAFSGFSHGSFLDDPRPLGLLLEDVPYICARISAALGMAGRRGRCWLFLPAMPAQHASSAGQTPQAEADWPARLETVVSRSAVQLDAVLHRVRMSLSELSALSVGDCLCLPDSTLEALTLETLTGRPLAQARLGQARGHRAIRLTTELCADGPTEGLAQPVASVRLLTTPNRQAALDASSRDEDDAPQGSHQSA